MFQKLGWAREGSWQAVWAQLSCSGGTRARPSGDGWARQWVSRVENIPWPVLLIWCLGTAQLLMDLLIPAALRGGGELLSRWG